MRENVDKTIDAICGWIQDEINTSPKPMVISEMTKALAELISARAQIE